MNSVNQTKSGEKLTDNELKQTLLGIMDSIHRFCEENNIRYYILNGTLLGAVRHKGFIPWDDDIDIGMLREDYEKFCRSYRDNINGYQLKCIYNDPQYYHPFAKVIDPRVSLYELVHKAPEIGAYIDVFPLDYIAQKPSGMFDNGAVRIWEELRYMQLKRDRALWKNCAILVSRIICPYSLHKLACIREKRAVSMSCAEKTLWLASLHGGWGKKEIAPSHCFEQMALYEFEGREYWGPQDYDGYLTCLYQDYMTLPPMQERASHHNFIATWK